MDEPEFFSNVRPTAPREDEPVVPERMKSLPWSKKHKVPIPWFVELVDGEPDFRVVKTERMVLAIQERRCWICGERLGKYLAFSIGPMCAINRISSEPPSHTECAIYAARVCPFLSHPNKDRRTAGLPEEVEPAAGIPLLHTPGVTLIWVCLAYQTEVHERTKLLFQIGGPVELHWYAEGRRATRVEIETAINKGLPFLQELASTEGPQAMVALSAVIDQARTLLPTV